MTKKVVLLLEDDESIQLVTSDFLSSEGYIVKASKTIKSLWKMIEDGEGDVIVTDVMLPDGESFEIIPQIKELRPNLPIIVVSARNNLQTAISSIEKGAFEYLPKPFDLNDLSNLILKAIQTKPIEKGKSLIRKKSSDLIIGSSKIMQEMYRVIGRLSQNDLTVTIYGESGTGKELVAKALHMFGKRADNPFIPVNMAAIPKDLIESELFGHEKGSFTGAHQKSDGKFKQAEKGTLFLDEIGDMSLSAQSKVLRAIQENKIQKVGSEKDIFVDTRVIAATNKDVKDLISTNKFREDLYHRISVIELNVPKLDDRKDDIPELVNHFLEQLSIQYDKSDIIIDNKALKKLSSFDWPGNVRELRNVVERLIILSESNCITDKDVLKFSGK